MGMRTLVVALGSAGDVHPFIGIALELRKRGHQVTFLTNSFFESLVRSLGLEFQSIGRVEDYERATRDPDLWNSTKGMEVVWRTVFEPAIRPTYDFIRDLADPRKYTTVASAWAFGARLAQEKLGVSLITAYLQPGMLRTQYGPLEIAGVRVPGWMPNRVRRWLWKMIDALYLDRLFGPALNRFRQELGLKPVNEILGHWIHSPDRGIALFPDWFAQPPQDWPNQVAITGFPLFDERSLHDLPTELEEFLAEGDHPVVFTPGSAMEHAAEFFRVSLEACLALRRRAIFLTSYHDQLPRELPHTIRHFDYVPFSRLLPYAAALVHHGGIGSCAQAMKAGIPHLIMPMAHDQFSNAFRVEALGLGFNVRRNRYVKAVVIDKLENLLKAESIKLRCREVAELFGRKNPLSEICDLVESTVYKPVIG
jgi:rhamnosyltransferase subunit B